MPEPLLAGKKGVILGVANKRSIAWGVARAAAEAGAELAFTYVGDKLERKVGALTEGMTGEGMTGAPPLYPCDVSKDDDIAALGDHLKRDFGTLDFLVHSVAFADRADLEGKFIDTSRAGYHLAQDISSYSLTAVAKATAPLMVDGGSIVTMTYLGAVRAIRNYNVMGVAKAALEASVRYLAAELGEHKIRVNAVSAGPVNTLAARGISGFSAILDHVAAAAPLRRNVEVEEVAAAAVFLLSSMAGGITGETLYVDCGYNTVGL